MPFSSFQSRWVYFFTVSFLALSHLCTGQYSDNYEPRNTSFPHAEVLIKSSKEQMQHELDLIKSRSKLKISKAYKTSAKRMWEGLKNDRFIHDDTLQGFVEVMFNKILLKNKLEDSPERVLILRDPRPGAFCMGDGTVTLTIGLLSILGNESQLAFILSHEIAHFTQHHIREKVKSQMESLGDRKEMFEEQMDKMVKGRVDLEGMDSLKTMVYSGYTFSREKEKESDAVGIAYMNRAGYDVAESITIMVKLDEVIEAKYPQGDKLFSAFEFSKYPLQEHWLKPRANIYHRRRGDLLFDDDKVRTHPVLEERLRLLENHVAKINNPKLSSESNFPQLLENIVLTAEFEAIQAAFDSRKFDICLQLALQQKNRFPNNAFLTSIIAKTLLAIYEGSGQSPDVRFNSKPIPKITQGYNPEERKVNDFIHNLKRKELAMIAFHFMNNRSNFNASIEEHYYILWQIGKILKDKKLITKVFSTYSKKFEKGKYLNSMR